VLDLEAGVLDIGQAALPGDGAGLVAADAELEPEGAGPTATAALAASGVCSGRRNTSTRSILGLDLVAGGSSWSNAVGSATVRPLHRRTI
jgi:hypothetical protein